MTAKTVPYRSTTIKWNELPIHPANNAPRMSDAEIAELAEDIKAHGMHEPIILWRDNSEEANGAEGPFPVCLLDGRNRLAALKLLGIDDPYQAQYGDLSINTVITLKAVKEVFGLSLNSGKTKGRWEVDCDPYAFHRSLNVFRRHLTPEQRRWMIKQAIARDPRAKDREIGRQLKVSPTTVGAVRAEMNGVQPVQLGQNEHLPSRRASEEVKANPTASVREIAKKANVSVGTAQKARRQLTGNDRDKTPTIKTAAASSMSEKTAPSTPIDRADSVTVHTALMNLAEAIGKIEPEIMVASGVIFPDEVGQMLDEVGAIRDWLDRFVARLGGSLAWKEVDDGYVALLHDDRGYLIMRDEAELGDEEEPEGYNVSYRDPQITDVYRLHCETLGTNIATAEMAKEIAQRHYMLNDPAAAPSINGGTNV